MLKDGNFGSHLEGTVEKKKGAGQLPEKSGLDQREGL